MSSSGWAQTPRIVPRSAASIMRRDASGEPGPPLGARAADPLADPLRQSLRERLATALRGDQDLQVPLELDVVVAVRTPREMGLELNRELPEALTVHVALDLAQRLPTSHVALLTHRR